MVAEKHVVVVLRHGSSYSCLHRERISNRKGEQFVIYPTDATATRVRGSLRVENNDCARANG